MRQHYLGYMKNQSCLNEEEENTGIRYNGPQQQLCHPAHHDEQQQQLQQQQCSNTQSSSCSSGNSTTYAQIAHVCLQTCIVRVSFRHESNPPILQQSFPPNSSVVSLTVFLNQQISCFLFLEAPPNTSLKAPPNALTPLFLCKPS